MKKTAANIKAPKIRTEWNLKLLYSGENDPQIEKDMTAFEKAAEIFEKRYRTDTKYLSSAAELKKALDAYEKLSGMPEAIRGLFYFNYVKDLDSTNQKSEAMMNILSSRLTKAANRIVFFTLALGKIPAPKQKEFLADKALGHFTYFLSKLFANAKHQLSEAEEKVLSLKSLPGYSMWVSGQEKLLNVQTVMFKGKPMPIPQASNSIKDLPTAERRKLHNDMVAVLRSISDFAESEINAIYTNKKIDDELRGFALPYEATLLSHQTNKATVEALCKAVTDNFSISHEFYKVKSKLLGLPKLEYADRAAVVGKNEKKIPFEKQYEMLYTAFANTDPYFAEILRVYGEQGQIDVKPKKGKTGGAYCSGATGLPTYVLLNDVGTADSLMTFGHEMGHAIHTEMSKTQPIIYEDYTTAVAEVASTFFENIAFEEIFKTLSEKEKVIALHDRIQDDIQTVFRQIACFNFEKDIHNAVRTAGAVSKEALAELHNKNMKAYLGPQFAMKENDGYQFVSWSHIRRFFYVYSYAYGQLISKALYARYKEDKSYLLEVKKFLSAGGSKSPEDIFKDIGIDTSKPSFFLEGLKSIQRDIARLDSLVKKRGR